MKRCPDCGETKPVEEFGRNRARPDGLAHYCRTCFRARAAEAYRRRRAAEGKTVREHPPVPAGHKFCPDCQQVLAVESFQRHGQQSGGRASYCKPCKRRRDAARRLVREYGLDAASLARLRESQGGRCAVCRRGPAEHVDHDHVTGQVRGLLCFRCNVGLGNFQDDAERLRAAANYVAHHSWQHVRVEAGVFRMVPPRSSAAGRTQQEGREPSAPAPPAHGPV